MITQYGAITVKKGVVTNQQQLRQTLGAYCMVMGGKAAKLLKKQARLFCDDMLDFTMPFAGGMGHDGRSRQAQKVGMDVVRSQIKKIFLPLQFVGAGEILQYGQEGVFSAWLRARRKLTNPMLPSWLKDGDNFPGLWKKFQEWEFAKQEAGMSIGFVHLDTYNKGSSVIKGIHERERGGNSIPEYFDNMKKSASYGQRYVVDDDGSAVKAYSKRVEAHVGRLKAGWYSVGSQLGRMKGVGYWIRGNQWNTGILIDQLGNGALPSVTVGNKVQGLHRSTKDGYTLAISYRAYSMHEEIYQKLVKNGNADMLFHLATHHGIGGGFDIT
jgi:hypothetical protein